jgi:hypothetical protein
MGTLHDNDRIVTVTEGVHYSVLHSKNLLKGERERVRESSVFEREVRQSEPGVLREHQLVSVLR